MPVCRECKDDADELVAADRLREELEISAEAAMQYMMGSKGCWS